MEFACNKKNTVIYEENSTRFLEMASPAPEKRLLDTAVVV
jgi:hypothetical protein